MGALWIGRAAVRDPEAMKEYGRLQGLAAKAYPDMQVLARAGQYRVLEGSDAFDRYVVLKFGSMQQALDYYNSSEYRAATAVRRVACDACDLVITETVD